LDQFQPRKDDDDDDLIRQACASVEEDLSAVEVISDSRVWASCMCRRGMPFHSHTHTHTHTHKPFSRWPVLISRRRYGRFPEHFDASCRCLPQDLTQTCVRRPTIDVASLYMYM